MIIYKKLLASGLILGFGFLTVYSWTSRGVMNTSQLNDLLTGLVILGSAGTLLACHIRIRLGLEDNE